MATYRAMIDWSLTAPTEDFPKGRYSRAHTVAFGSGVEVPATASHHVVGNKWAAPNAVDPEEMLVGAASACHMLSFLHIAREAGFVVTRYRDAAEGVMEKIAGERMAITRITLRPEIAYDGRQPTEAERAHMHHEAHELCFIANSLKAEVVVEERVLT